MSAPKRPRLLVSEVVIIGDSDDSNSSSDINIEDYQSILDEQQKKLAQAFAVQPDQKPCTSKEADENVKRKRPIKPPTPQCTVETDDDDLPTGVPPYMSTELYEELLKDSTEKRLIWNRLRHGLNPHCLAHIFDYLPVAQLAKVIEMSDFFKDVINEHVIAKKLIDFTNMANDWSTDQFFRIFGKRMRKIKITKESTLDSFPHFLTLLTRYCEKDRLVDLELKFGDTECSSALIQKVMPFFTNLQRLFINDGFLKPDNAEFLRQIALNATKLKTLEYQGFFLDGQWCNIMGLNELTKLSLECLRANSSVDFDKFLTSLPKLKQFDFSGSFDLSSNIKALANASPDLEIFHDKCLHNSYGKRAQIEPELERRYEGIASMKNLRVLGVTCFTLCGSDLHYTLMRLPKTVEKLTVFMDFEDIKSVLPATEHQSRLEVDNNQWLRVKYLKSFAIRFNNLDYYGHKQEILNCEYILKGLSQSPNIETLILEFNCIKDVYKIFELVPHIKELDISQVLMKYLPVEMTRIFRTIRKNRLDQGLTNDATGKPSIHLILNRRQYNEILVHRDIRNMATIEINPNDPGFKVLRP